MHDNHTKLIAKPSQVASQVASQEIRTGCISCRAKGVRCDPSGLDCKRSISTAWDANRASALTAVRHGCRNALLTSVGMDYTWEGTLRERQSLHFLCTISAPEFSGYLDHAFWQRMLLTAARADEAIRHAAAAVGAAHELLLRRQVDRCNTETDRLEAFALRQYNKAIARLLDSKCSETAGDISRALIASVLFTAFEHLQGRKVEALIHVDHSRRLLKHHDHQSAVRKSAGCKSASLAVDIETLKPIISHYEVQTSHPGKLYNLGLPDAVRSVPWPSALETFSDFRVSLEMIVVELSIACFGLRDYRTNPEQLVIAAVKKRMRYEAWVQAWKDHFEVFLELQGTCIDSSTRKGCLVLQAHNRAAMILARVDIMKGERAWADHMSEFATILGLAQKVLEAMPRVRQQTPPLPIHGLSQRMGLTEPLSMVMLRCPDPDMQRAARALLTRLPASEGAWSEWKQGLIENVLSAATGKDFEAE